MGHTPLMLASAGGHTRIVQRLLANAAYPHVTKLGFVSRRQGPAVNSVDDDGRTALHHAAEGGHHVIVKLLLEAGANAEVQDRKCATALDVCNSPEAFHLLRSRAELYARRERLEGVALKRNVSYNLFFFLRARSRFCVLSMTKEKQPREEKKKKKHMEDERTLIFDSSRVLWKGFLLLCRFAFPVSSVLCFS